MENKFIPQLGQEVYCIYRNSCILPNGVYALSNHSFIVEGFRSKNEDAWEYNFSDYGKTWFSDLEEAKLFLIGLYDKKKYKLVNIGDKCFDIMLKIKVKEN